MEVIFDQGERICQATGKFIGRCLRQATGKILGGCLYVNRRPIGTTQLNSCLYNVEFEDGTTDIISANTIANKIWD